MTTTKRRQAVSDIARIAFLMVAFALMWRDVYPTYFGGASIDEGKKIEAAGETPRD